MYQLVRIAGRTEPSVTRVPPFATCFGEPGKSLLWESARRTKDIHGSWKWARIAALLDVQELHDWNSARFKLDIKGNMFLPSDGCSRAGHTSAASNFPK